MTNMFKKTHIVKWYSGTLNASDVPYAMRGPLTAKFMDVCNIIINRIAAKGHIAKATKLLASNGVIITESLLNGEIIDAHLVWID